MKHNKFTYIGDSVPKIDKRKHEEFLRNFQKAMLLSLAERNLLTKAQVDQVLERLIVQSKY